MKLFFSLFLVEGIVKEANKLACLVLLLLVHCTVRPSLTEIGMEAAMFPNTLPLSPFPTGDDTGTAF